MTDNPAPGKQWHPHWCDLAQCTMDQPGGSHSSSVMTLGPLPHTKLTVKANLYAIDGLPVPAALVSFHTPPSDTGDIEQAGGTDDISSVVLPPEQIALLTTFLGRLHDVATA